MNHHPCVCVCMQFDMLFPLIYLDIGFSMRRCLLVRRMKLVVDAHQKRGSIGIMALSAHRGGKGRATAIAGFGPTVHPCVLLFVTRQC